jgi:hypothetical protein
LQPHWVAERLGDLGHPDRLIAFHVWIYDRLAAALARRPLGLGSEFKVNSHA